MHVPCSIAGWVVAVLAVGFCVNVVVAIDRHSHSVSDTLYGAFPFVACTFLLYDWIATRAGRD
jgi:hypothetical protein